MRFVDLSFPIRLQRREPGPRQAMIENEEGFFARRTAELETGSTQCRDA